MDSDFAAQSEQLQNDVGSAANTIMLPESSMNGAGNGNGIVGDMDFLEEPLAMMQTDPMAEFNALDGADDAVATRKGLRSSQKSDVEHTAAPEDDDEAEEAPATRTPSQVPKKRRDAAMLAAAATDGEHDEVDEEYIEEVIKETPAKILEKQKQNNAGDGDGNTVELPTSSTRANAAANTAKENTVEENQCRVCTTKDDLVSLFKKVEKLTVAEMLMIICPAVSIARKDFMPQFICNTCLDNVTIAVQLKNQCESTEKELRKKLSRSKNKLRRPTAGYVVIDAPLESDPASEEEAKDDIEFKVSDVEVSASGDDDSEDSDFGATAQKKKLRTTRGSTGGGTGRGRGRRKSAVAPTPKLKEKKRMGRPPLVKVETTAISSEEEDELEEKGEESEVAIAPPKKKRRKRGSAKDADPPTEKPTEFPCDECEQVFTRKLSLVLHKKAHSGGREPINCEVCGKQFKIQGAYRSHLEKHKEDAATPHNCSKCEKSFMTKADLRRHVADAHDDVSVYFTCEKCKRVFTTEQRLTRHKENRCPGYEVKSAPRRSDLESYGVGKDLFKTVAPLTTTYWSDSFSD